MVKIVPLVAKASLIPSGDHVGAKLVGASPITLWPLPSAFITPMKALTT